MNCVNVVDLYLQYSLQVVVAVVFLLPPVLVVSILNVVLSILPCHIDIYLHYHLSIHMFPIVFIIKEDDIQMLTQIILSM